MSPHTEFRPVAHEFLSKGFHGAAFVGAKAADAFWFYRFDSSFIEVRDTFTCHDKVFASLSTTDIKQRFKHLLKSDEIQIVNVQDAYVGESHTIVFVVREGEEDRDHKGQQGPDSPTSIDLDEEQDDDNAEEDQTKSKWRTHNNRKQLLVLGHRNGWVAIYKFTVSVTGQVACNKEPEHEKWLEDGSITCLATLSSKNTGARPVIVAGTSEGKVVVIRYDDAQEVNKLESLMTIKDLHSKTLPITSLTLETTKDDALDLLVVGQGSWQGTVKESKESPAVSMYYLRLQKSDSRLLGYVRPPTVEGEVSTGGSTLVTAVSEDSLGRRVHCAFSTTFENSPSLSHLATVQINQNDVPEPDVKSMDDVGGGSLLDISPQTNSTEFIVLYLGKLVSISKAADIEFDRLEAEWAEGGKGQESARRDMAPLYNSFFQEKAKFTYSDSELREIEQRRKQLGGRLFYDRLLEFVDVHIGTLYPPKNHSQQRNLWTNIYVLGNLESDNRNCLAYYLLKNQHGDVSEQFLREYRIPPKFVDLINGFWALDHFDFKTAVLYLSRPGLTVDWIEDVVEAIAQHGSPQLARQFIVAADLDYTSDKFIETKMKTLIETDFSEAFYYQRSPAVTGRSTSATQQDGVRTALDSADRKKRLFISLLDYCFLDKPNRKGIQALLQLTMNESEEQMFIQYCDNHSGLTREVGQEFLIMYYVDRSRLMEAIRMHRKRLAVEREQDEKEQFHRAAIDRRNSRQFGGDKNGAQSSQSLSKSQKRQVLVDQLIKVLPVPQRLILELEEEKQQQDSTSPTGTHATTTTRAPLSSYLSFNTGRDVQQGQGAKKKDDFAAGGKGILQALLDVTDGAPSMSLKGLDLDRVTRSLAGEEEAVDQEKEGQAMFVSDDSEEKGKVLTVEIMELD
ncbi:hypothetical protein BGW39_002151 [Mortierella sp. 14UC]|nr:hypothetical protein BGW39_002151 [Mortierella sp. 14UC]